MAATEGNPPSTDPGEATTEIGQLRADPARTVERMVELRRYMDANVLGPGGFCCASLATCRGSIRAQDRFYEGQLSHVGRHYDLALDGRPLRIVVVGQEDGGARTLISLDQRYEEIHDTSGMARRYYAEPSHPARNPHMRGTTSVLRVILGQGLGANWEEEFVQTLGGERFHVFDAFALVNALLCGAHPVGSAQGRSTKVMRRNCLRHFAATMQILEPTLMVLQGEGVQSWIGPVLGVMAERTENLGEAHVAGNRVLVCRFSHPSAHGVLRWGDRLDAPYLREVVEPTLRLAAESL
ncbi:MAG TPA: hypothetical protein VF972_08545 [Actinomycetota bacterium]